MTYVDGFVLPVPTKNLPAYRRMAKLASKVWMEHGALDYKECVGDDLAVKCGTSFTKMMAPKRGETLVFAWITYKSRAHRDKVNAKAIMDPRLTAGIDPKKMPFDSDRMVYGGFKAFVEV